MKIRRNSITMSIRHEVFKRDGYRCLECGATNKDTRLHTDHIIPVSQGGSDELNNLQTLCEDCNIAKANRAWRAGVISDTTQHCQIDIQDNIDPDQEVLTWLYNEGALDYGSSIDGKNYVEKIMEKYGVKERQARRIQTIHSINGWIKKRQIQHGVKVWVGNFTPLFKKKVTPIKCVG